MSGVKLQYFGGRNCRWKQQIGQIQIQTRTRDCCFPWCLVSILSVFITERSLSVLPFFLPFLITFSKTNSKCYNVSQTFLWPQVKANLIVFKNIKFCTGRNIDTWFLKYFTNENQKILHVFILNFCDSLLVVESHFTTVTIPTSFINTETEILQPSLQFWPSQVKVHNFFPID